MQMHLNYVESSYLIVRYLSKTCKKYNIREKSRQQEKVVESWGLTFYKFV